MDQLTQIIGYCYAAVFAFSGAMLFVGGFIRFGKFSVEREPYALAQLAAGTILMLLSLFVLNW